MIDPAEPARDTPPKPPPGQSILRSERHPRNPGPAENRDDTVRRREAAPPLLVLRARGPGTQRSTGATGEWILPGLLRRGNQDPLPVHDLRQIAGRAAGLGCHA